MNPFGNLKNHWKYLKTTWFKPFKQWKPERIFFFWVVEFQCPAREEYFWWSGTVKSCHCWFGGESWWGLQMNHRKKTFLFPRLFVFGKFFGIKDGKKIAKSTKFFSFLPRKLGKMNPFLTSVFFKGVGSTTNQLFISINFMSPKGFTPPPVFQLIPPKVRFFFFWLWKFPARNGWLIFAQEETSEVAGGESWWGSVSWKNGRLLFVHFYQLEGPLKPATFVSLKKGKNQVFQVGR